MGTPDVAYAVLTLKADMAGLRNYGGVRELWSSIKPGGKTCRHNTISSMRFMTWRLKSIVVRASLEASEGRTRATNAFSDKPTACADE